MRQKEKWLERLTKCPSGGRNSPYNIRISPLHFSHNGDCKICEKKGKALAG
jgi:hypothetical protein